MMDYSSLSLTLVYAKGLKKSRFIGKMHVYAVVFVSGTISEYQKQRTSMDKHVDSNPTWNFPMKFCIDEVSGVTLVVKIKGEGIFGGKNLGEVHVPVKELLEGVKGGNGKEVHTVSYQVTRPSGKPNGVLSFMYEFGEKSAYLAYPPHGMGMASMYPTKSYAEQPAGYSYQNQHPGHVYYPPPRRPVVPPRRCSSMGFGFGNSSMGFGFGSGRFASGSTQLGC